MITIDRKDLPTWYQIKPNINGYRRPMPCGRAFLSIFQWHNETLNIYTHLLPALYFVSKLFYTVECSPQCRLLYYTGYGFAATLGFCSAIAHTFYIVEKWNSIVWKLDFIAIILINLSHQFLDTYILCITEFHYFYPAIFLEMAAAAYCIQSIWRNSLETARFWGLVYPFLSSVPLTFPLYIYVRDPLIIPLTQASMNCSLCILVAGVVFFKGEFPERFFNNVLINSHTYHHILIIVAILQAFEAFPFIL